MLELLLMLMLKHTVADYYTQYSWMMKDKGRYLGFGGIAHSSWHGILTASILIYFNPMGGIPILWCLLLGVLDSVIHYHIDFIKSNVWKTKNYGPNTQMYWVTHGTDQFLHFATYILIIYIIDKFI